MDTMPIKISSRPSPSVVFCLPGSSFSNSFLGSWSELLVAVLRAGITPYISQAQDPMVYYVRNKCLNGDVLRGRNQKPFDGKLKYDYLMWIDSDIVFTPEHFFKLLDRAQSSKLDILSGLYMMQGGRNFAVVKEWDEEFFKKNGFFQFLAMDDVKDKKDIMEVDYSGFGFMLVKYGVFESLEYPWFQPVFHDIGNAHDFSSEDVSFCKMIKQKRYKIYIDPTIRVGHEKKCIY